MLDSWRKWLQTRMNGNFQDTDRIARAIFRLEQIPDVLGVLGRYDSEPPDSVYRAVLAQSKGNLDALLDCRGCERLHWPPGG